MSLLLGATDRRYFKILSVDILLRFINVESKIVPGRSHSARDDALWGPRGCLLLDLRLSHGCRQESDTGKLLCFVFVFV